MGMLTGYRQGGFNVGGHVIRTFEGVFVVGFVFAHQRVKAGSKIAAHRGVGIFAEREAG